MREGGILDNELRKELLRKELKQKNKGKKSIPTKYRPKYPDSAEREYLRMVNAYMAIEKEILIKYLPELKRILNEGTQLRVDSKKENEEKRKIARFSAIDNTIVRLTILFKNIKRELDAAFGLYDLKRQINKIASLDHKLTIREWKKAVSKTLGINLLDEDIIAEQKADLDTLLSEIDKLQATNDMNGDEDEETENGADTAPSEDENTDSDDTGEGNESDPEKKGVNMDSVEKIIAARLDVCRMADKLNLDGVEGLSVKEGRKRIIKAVNPKINLDGKSDSYINAAYDIAKQSYCERKSTNEQRQQMVTDKARRDAKEESNSNSARKNMISRMTGGKK